AKAFYGAQEYGVNLRGSTSNDDAQAAQLSHWANQDVLKNYLANNIIKQSDNDFYAFYGRTVVYGATAGLSAGVPFLEAANAAREGTTTGSILTYLLASRAGAGVSAGAVNATSQLIQDGKVRWVNVGVAATTGSLGVGGGLVWNTAIGAAGGAVQTDLNNWIYNENKNMFLSAIVAGASGGAGFWVGDKTTKLLSNKIPGSLIPTNAGNVAGPSVSEGVSPFFEQLIGTQDDQKKQSDEARHK
ncbi:hypothetical protein, partial [Frateuria defendens]|uniref:hypothetical protein n=1 Tax=Frateuria defendens TaxID=2219559 RepID=UPI001F378BAE